MKLILLFFLFFSLLSCNAKKSLIRNDINNKSRQINQTSQDEQIQKSDSLFTSIEKTPCYGTCPVYSIKIYDGGYVVYHGVRFVEKIGFYYTHISSAQLKAIKEKVIETNYFQLNNTYVNQGLVDLPTTITSVNISGQKKTIKNGYDNPPSSLVAFEKFLENMFITAEWHALK